jgi:hypothetical protein
MYAISKFVGIVSTKASILCLDSLIIEYSSLMDGFWPLDLFLYEDF